MRISTTYKVAGPKTFRLASTQILPKWIVVKERNRQGNIEDKRVKKGWGGNVQNITKEMRGMYIPDGYINELESKCVYFLTTGDWSVFTKEELESLRIMIQADQSGAEALITAYLCENKNYRQLFINGVKPHVYLAIQLFKDVWPRKMREHNIITGDSSFDINEIINTPIPLLKKNPFWKDLDLLIKDSDNWSMSERYYFLAKQTEHSCVDKETMVLTKKGWCFIDDAVKAFDDETLNQIAIFKDGEIKFEKPSFWNIGDYTGDMYEFDGEEVNQFVTPNHKVVYNSNQSLLTKPASSVYYLNSLPIPTSGLYDGGNVNLPDWQIKLLVAIQADAHWCESEAKDSTERLPKVIFRLKKKRKIERLISILNEGKIPYSNKLHAHNITCITINNLQDTLKYFNNVKQWDSWILSLSKNNLETLVYELKYWDGTFTESRLHKREAYFTSLKINASWIKLVCHLTNRQGTRSKTYDLYSIGINNRRFSRAKGRKIKNWSGKVYCPTVSSGMFLINRKGKISITGNSNYDVQPPMFRMNTLEKSGGKVVISKEDSERFLMTKFALFPEIKGFHRWVADIANKHRMLFNLHGHPYTITSWEILESHLKELYAWISQSTVGEITNIAYAKMQSFIEDNKLRWDMLQNNHDSYLIQCPLPEAKECALKAKEFIEQHFVSPIDGAEFQMKSEVQWGFNWSPFKKEKNILGLREIKGL